MKMKANSLNFIISLFLLLLIVPGIVPGLAYALDGQPEDGLNSNETPTSNLIIDTLSVSPRNPAPNEDVSISLKVINEGDAASNPTFIMYSIGGKEALEYLTSLEPGSSSMITHNWTAPGQPGTVPITASIIGIENSQKKTSITVQIPLPDLVVQSIVTEPASPQVGQPVNITVKVKNQGTVPSEATLASYFINDIPGQQMSVPALPEGDTATVSFSLAPEQVTQGKTDVKVSVDPGNTVPESNERNNERTKSLSVNGLPPDLKVESISLNPVSPNIGDNISFTATVRNIGAGASAASNLKYYINRTGDARTTLMSDTLDVNALAAGSDSQITFYLTPQNEGEIEVTAVTDPDASITESDETNNQLTIYATVNSASSGGGSSSGSSGSSSGSSSHSSSSGFGSSSSTEPSINVDSKELATRNIIGGTHIRFDFPKNSTSIMFLEYDALKTFQRTTTTVEELKNRSTFVPVSPSGTVYKYDNIWIGDRLGGLPESIANASIGFRVEKSWLNNNNVNESLITLQSYNKSWEPLSTSKVGEDEKYSYFTSKVPRYSFFAITYTGPVGNESQVTTKLQDSLLGSLTNTGKALNASGSKSSAEEAKGAAKIMMAIILPLFLVFVGYLVFKKKI